MSCSLCVLLALALLAPGAADGSCPSGGAACSSALARARLLTPPAPSATANGEFEGAAFWETNDALLAQAWSEYGAIHRALYTFDAQFEERYIAPAARAAVRVAQRDLDESGVHSLFGEQSPSVWTTERLFTDAFHTEMLAELDHLAAAGIPMRR
jgi:hypothetical protein